MLRIHDWTEVPPYGGSIRANFSVELTAYSLVISGFSFGETRDGRPFVHVPRRKIGDAKIDIVAFSDPEARSWFLRSLVDLVVSPDAACRIPALV